MLAHIVVVTGAGQLALGLIGGGALAGALVVTCARLRCCVSRNAARISELEAAEAKREAERQRIQKAFADQLPLRSI